MGIDAVGDVSARNVNIFPRYFRQTYASERTPAYRGGSFLLQREQRHGLQRVAAAYTLSTGVDSRATHGILWITSGRYPPGFFPNIDGRVFIAVMVTATFRAIPFPYR